MEWRESIYLCCKQSYPKRRRQPPSARFSRVVDQLWMIQAEEEHCWERLQNVTLRIVVLLRLMVAFKGQFVCWLSLLFATDRLQGSVVVSWCTSHVHQTN